MLADPTSDFECGMCHHRGCLSSVVGGTALLRQLDERHGESGGAELLEYLSKNRTPNNQDAGARRVISRMIVDARALIKAANIMGGRANGPRFPLAYDIVQKAAEPLGAAICQIVCLLDPSIVVLGGILSNAEYLEETLGDVARQYIPHFRRGRNHLVFTEFSDFAQTVQGGQPLCGDEAALYGTAMALFPVPFGPRKRSASSSTSRSNELDGTKYCVRFRSCLATSSPKSSLRSRSYAFTAGSPRRPPQP
jgi:predicted NBD/HSP70 family sugar kinase